MGQLSGGERNRVHMAKIFKSGANVLLLDEPTNDLDVETMRSLEEALVDFGAHGAALVVSHDRWFLDRVCTHVLRLGNDKVYDNDNDNDNDDDDDSESNDSKNGGWAFWEGGVSSGN